MAPNALAIHENTDHFDTSSSPKKHPQTKYRIITILSAIVFHVLTFHGMLKLHQIKMWTLLYSFALVSLSMFGTTAGAHRLWAHRTYKAKEPLRLLLFVCFALSGQMPLYVWVKVHRQHHKFADTEADPHNSKRGFWFSHIGWIMMDKTPECRQEEKEIDMSDILQDPLASCPAKYHYGLSSAIFVLLPLIPVYCWEENLYLSFIASGVLRYIFTLHLVLSVNSFSHMLGSRPYDKRIQPTEGAIVSFLTLGEGWHNYHHTFPWDYKAAEFGDRINVTARLLDLFGKMGWAYDFKTASPQLVASTREKVGDHGSESTLTPQKIH